VDLNDIFFWLWLFAFFFGLPSFAGLRAFLRQRRKDRLSAAETSRKLAIKAEQREADVTRAEARYNQLLTELLEAGRFVADGSSEQQQLGDGFVALQEARELLDDDNLADAKKQLRAVQEVLLRVNPGFKRSQQSLPPGINEPTPPKSLE
jgi:hypothetical protein